MMLTPRLRSGPAYGGPNSFQTNLSRYSRPYIYEAGARPRAELTDPVAELQLPRWPINSARLVTDGGGMVVSEIYCSQ
jgi:hypothetical protein